MQTTTLIIAQRFCGPPRSGNGGYVSGQLATRLDPAGSTAIVVRLKLPPPLETPLIIQHNTEQATLWHGDQLIAAACRAALDITVPAIPSWETAIASSLHYTGFNDHPFGGCFVCGPDRAPGDGLRIFPGKVTGHEEHNLVAAPWIPDAQLAAENGFIHRTYMWAALDCTGAFAVRPVPNPDKAIVLGEFTVRIDQPIAPDSHCILSGWVLSNAGRRRVVGSALMNEAGQIAAVATATWIEVSRKDFFAS